eukprot:m.148857 g.148857  ORF g.148857 m.148857 type:complete len:170 (+) comp10122_c0_seq16:1990-2499(+)
MHFPSPSKRNKPHKPPRTMTLCVRSAHDGSMKSAIRALAAAVRSAPVGSALQRAEEALAGELDSAPLAWIVEDGSAQPTGAAVGRPGRAGVFELLFLGVAPHARCRGAGSLLLSTAEQHATQAGFTAVETQFGVSKVLCLSVCVTKAATALQGRMHCLCSTFSDAEGIG